MTTESGREPLMERKPIEPVLEPYLERWGWPDDPHGIYLLPRHLADGIRAEERAVRASLEARMSRMQIYIHTIDVRAGHEPPYETCPHLDCTTTRALTEPDARALAGASTPAPVLQPIYDCPVCEAEDVTPSMGTANGESIYHTWYDGNGIPTACGPLVPRPPVPEDGTGGAADG